MLEKNIAFRVDATNQIGTGHFMRCLSLADMLKRQGLQILFVSRHLPEHLGAMLATKGHRCSLLDDVDKQATQGGLAHSHWLECSQVQDADETIKALSGKQWDWLIVDHYALDIEWESVMRPYSKYIMVIDDLADRKHDCDLLLDQNYYCDMGRRYQALVPKHCVTLLGPSYVLLRAEFYEARRELRERDGSVRRIHVFFGGSDLTNQTKNVVEAVKLLGDIDIKVDVVVGADNPYRNEIRALCEELANVGFHCQVSNMADLIQRSDLGIGAGGTAMWERCFLGLPTMTVVVADNQERTAKDVGSIGAIEYLGWYNQLDPEIYASEISKLIKNPQRVKQIGEEALSIMRGKAGSVEEVMHHIETNTEGLHPLCTDNAKQSIQPQAGSFIDKRLQKHALGFWEIAIKPSSQELQKHYADRYYQEAKGSYEHEYTKDELLFIKAKLEQRLAALEIYLPQSGNESKGRMLDVGCGEGFTLAFFREKGWLVKGIDFSSAGVRSKNPECLDVLVEGDVFSLLQAEITVGDTYDVIWLQNVLEHVIDPLALLESLRKLVSPGGLAVVTVPNDYSVTQRALFDHKHIDSAFWVVPPEHLAYFDSVSLTNTAKAAGWDCVDLLCDFPIDWFLFHPGSNYIQNKPAAGKSAHKARVQIENLIHEQHIGDVLRFWSAAAKLGMGRNITAFLRPVVAG